MTIRVVKRIEESVGQENVKMESDEDITPTIKREVVSDDSVRYQEGRIS